MSAPTNPLPNRRGSSTVVPYRRPAVGTQPDSAYEGYRATRRRAPSKPLIYLPHTLSEVTGPVFGHAFATRLIGQMYFPGDPLFAYDPILQSIPDEKSRQRLISKFDLETTKPEWALGYCFDIILRGREATPLDRPKDRSKGN